MSTLPLWLLLGMVVFVLVLAKRTSHKSRTPAPPTSLPYTPPPVPPKRPTSITCMYCGTVNKLSRITCDRCGAPLPEHDVQDDALDALRYAWQEGDFYRPARLSTMSASSDFWPEPEQTDHDNY